MAIRRLRFATPACWRCCCPPPRPPAAEAPTRDEYVEQLEAICKPDAEATQRAMKGARADIQRRTARRRRRQVRQGDHDLRRHREGDLGRAAADRRRGEAGQVVQLPEAPAVLLRADHRPAAGRPRDQGPAPDRALHPQRQPRQQRRPRLRLQLLQLQVLQVRGEGARPRSWRSRCCGRWRCSRPGARRRAAQGERTQRAT